MQFDFFSLWFIYYPVSGILWFWHKVFGAVLGDANGFAWALSVIFMTFTLRALLIKPFVSQVRSMRKMQEFSPQIKKLQEKHKNDKQKLAEEMQKLQKEHGVNPLGGCLPVFVQLPVFIGLFHVLKGFQPNFPFNYVFDRQGVESFLDSDLFGVRLSDAIAGGAQALGQISFNFGDFQAHVIPVALPLMIVSSVATHFTARVSQAHQSAAAAANPQAAMMGNLTKWVFPIGILVFGAFLPVAILMYWLSNNTWTLAQQYLVYKKIDREEQEKRDEAREQRDQLAPKVGQKPVAGQKPTVGQKPNRGRPTDGEVTSDEPSDVVATDAIDTDDAEPQDAVSTAGGRTPAAAKSPAKGSGRAAPGKVGGGAGRGSGSASPGKVGGTSSNGAGKSGAGKNGAGKNGAGKNGAGKNGAAKNGSAKGGGGKNGATKNGGGKSGAGKNGAAKKQR